MQPFVQPVLLSALVAACFVSLLAGAMGEPAETGKQVSPTKKKVSPPSRKMPAPHQKKTSSAQMAPAGINPNAGEKLGKPRRAAAATPVGRRGPTPGFTNRIQPLLGKMGCNGRSCHGSFQGQGGFQLSLFGSNPQFDRDALHDSDAPRVDLQNPDSSLMLLKATEKVDHGGGKRFAVGSWQYQMLRDWIAAGAPYDAGEARVERIEVLPRQVVFASAGQQAALRVVANYADDSQEDVTSLTQFSTNDEVIAGVTDAGVATAGSPGDTAIVAAFGGSVGTTHVLVPLAAGAQRSFTFPANNRIDELVAAKWRMLGYEPSGLSTDAEFLRRVSLDLIGTLPTVAEAREFLADTDSRKRSRLIDALLDRPEYALYWATKFSDLTGNDSSVTPAPAAKTSWLWYGWLAEKLRANLPYDELVAGFVTATTREGRSIDDTLAEYREVAADIMPPWSQVTQSFRADWEGRDGFGSAAYAQRKTNDLFWRTYELPETAALRISYAFLGVRLECAQCHKHPYDRWTQQDFLGFTAFFAGVSHGVPDDVPGDATLPTGGDERTRALVYRYDEVYSGSPRAGRKAKGKTNLNVDRTVTPRLLGGKDVTVLPGQDPRTILMSWMRDAENPFFAPALVNRLWHHYLGVALFEPTDELSAANPPSNPELLDWLARSFIDHKFDLKHLHRTILNSRVYQLSWRPHGNNSLDERNSTHARLRRLPAEVLVDAIDQITGSRQEAFAWNGKTYASSIAPEGTRAIALAPTRLGQARARYPLEVFGRPMRGERCDAERSLDVTLSQALYLLYDDDVLRKISAADGRLAQLLQDTPDNRRVIENLYLGAVSRLPTAEETTQALDYVSRAGNRQAGFEDVLWSLINLREFTFNH